MNDFGQLTTVCKAQLSLDERLQCGITKKENIRVRSVKEAAHEGKKAEKKVEKSFSKPEQPKTTTKPEQPKASTKPEQPKSMFLGKRKPEEVDESEQPNKKANVGPQKTNPFSAGKNERKRGILFL